MTTNYVETTEESGKAFVMRGIKGDVVMLNLLRFREIADYSATPELTPAKPISGREAYQLYMEHTTPFLQRYGSELLFSGDSGNFLIGPMDEVWDLALLVRHESVQKFMAFAADEAYLAGVGHRTAALLDSRLLPLTEINGNLS